MSIKWNNCVGAVRVIALKFKPHPRNSNHCLERLEWRRRSIPLRWCGAVWCRSNSDLRASIHRTEAEKTIFSKWRLEKSRRQSSRLSLHWSGPLDSRVEMPRRRSSRSSLHQPTVTSGKSRSHILFRFFYYLDILIVCNNYFQNKQELLMESLFRYIFYIHICIFVIIHICKQTIIQHTYMHICNRVLFRFF